MPARDHALSQSDYTRLCRLVREHAGIALGDGRRTMLEARIRHRMRALGIDSYGHYCDRLFEPGGLDRELVSLLDAVTTNKTDFFRESRHFEFLTARALPELVPTLAGRPLLVWSAGCSTGEEPYTLAMVLSEYAAVNAGFRFRILATDISTQVLARAERAVYSLDAASPIAGHLKKKYLLRSRNRECDEVRIAPELRQLIEFRRLNFMDADYGVDGMADFIFCRNVLIYFDRSTQESILTKLCRHLVPGGYLFVGHSETLHEMRLPVHPVGPALYRRSDAAA